MIKKKKSSTDKHSEGSSKKPEDKNSNKRHPNPDDLYKETEPSVKEIPLTGSPHHPHHEEILDGTPK